MSTTYIDIVFEGNKFSPKMLKKLTDLNIEALAESGEIGTKGRYKGKAMPYGLALLKIPQASPEDVNPALKKVIDKLLLKKKELSKSGVDEITLDLENFSEDEVEITIDREIIKGISALNASIDISTSNFQSKPAKSATRQTNEKSGLTAAKQKPLTGAGFNFSRQEMEILSLIKEGYTSREIAKILMKEESAIESLRRNMIKKSGAKNMIVLIYTAKTWGLI